MMALDDFICYIKLMSVDRFYYQSTIEEFLQRDKKTILGMIVANDTFSSLQSTQREAWIAQIDILKKVLAPFPDGLIVFEYIIPRLGKRIDVLIVIANLIFVLEFKVGSIYFFRNDVEQVWDYALDLKNFHQESHNKLIFPLLIATDAPDSSITTKEKISCYDDGVYEPILTNKAHLTHLLISLLKHQDLKKTHDSKNWLISRYCPTPSIIEAASHLFRTHSVENITRTDATGAQLKLTTDSLTSIIKKTKERKEKAICFVTGVPGAGKTLVGLHVAISQFDRNEDGNSDLAVYLSGNGPLVAVLTEALARDKLEQDKIREPNVRHYKSVARRQVRSFIQLVHHYRDNTLAKIKQVGNQIEIDPSKAVHTKSDGYSEIEHIAIFDEAQRAWNKEHLANWLSRRKGKKGFPLSEPEFLIWSMNLKPDWSLIICLVGGGQEINTGEAGIGEWLRAINTSFRDWKVYLPTALSKGEYAGENLKPLLRETLHLRTVDNLHLSVSMRSFRSENLSHFVHSLLEGEIESTQKIYHTLKEKYPIVLTRSLELAKEWLRSKKRGSERFGIVVSSQAYRLRPLAIDIRAKPDIIHWFLSDEDDIRSSLFMEDIATEFDVQGLELDWTCVVWDGDFRYSSSGWENYSFKGSKWNNIRSEARKRYQLNAYRVLLTRARQGMVIVVPEGNNEDPTRKKSYYDPTYSYLRDVGLALLN